MEESFEERPLLDRSELAALVQRGNLMSSVRLFLHLGAFLLCVLLLVEVSAIPLLAFLVAGFLASIWASLFTPLHECTHQTAFRSCALNAIGAWLTGILCGLSPGVYRAFHFAHHRHTNDPENDPELGDEPSPRGGWPNNVLAWCFLVSGVWHLRFKVVLLAKISLLPTARWDEFAPWMPAAQRRRLACETRIVAGVWLVLLAAALFGIPGARWLLAALLLSHVFQAVWQIAEHRGLPHEGGVLMRTRTMQPPKFIRWWLWNGNFHSEHHAWPAVPWHALPRLHQLMAPHLNHHAQGYCGLQLQAFRSINRFDQRTDLRGRRSVG